ncbi:MAG: Mut7-C ubiquitin/RNAse domain-containing protein [Spirochaetales bacterium]|nr:Mut7-C ubiquitin/RNAse domain-containing protein [Spirochaetales bacterium]
MYRVLIRFYEELNFFLKDQEKHRDLPVAFPGRRSMKDLIESLGVPHVEVDLILVNGNPVAFDYIVQDGDRISVYPEFEGLDITGVTPLKDRPLRHTAFVADVHLHTLARKLRMLGFDTDYEKHRDDDILAAISQQEKRVLLTRDRQLLMRKNVSRGLYIRSTDPDTQVREVLHRLDLYRHLTPFRRCVVCNALIEPLETDNPDYLRLLKSVPREILTRYKDFRYCPVCRRVYWKGRHVEKMEAFIASLKPEDQ